MSKEILIPIFNTLNITEWRNAGFRKSGSDAYNTPVTANWIVIEFVEGVMRV